MEGDCNIVGESSSNKHALDTNLVIDSPKVGMEFDTYDELVDYYTKYAKQEGFAVSKRTSKRGKDGLLRYALIECYKGGKPRRRGLNFFKPRPQSKVNCQARVRACLSCNGKFELTLVCLEHNHDISPSKVNFIRSYRNIDSDTKRKLELHDTAGVKLNKSFDVLQIEAGGPDNISFTQRDCRNYLSKSRRLRLMEGDAEAMNRYFIKMKADNEEFFYALDLDGKGRLKNVFWADARSRAAYAEFGDVVTFDTTYLVNRYDMPFAPFLSVNHHGNSILLGCGLVSHEDTESFVWLFETWLACMKGCAPVAIITDQCMAMKNAIEHVFPKSRHRWCLWHIMKKLPEKLSAYKEYERISYSMKQAIYDSLTVEEFESSWFAFIRKYDLHSNKWLDGLYVERARWVPAYLKGTFWAGMSSTQRSENINAYFDDFINSKTTLKQFVEQYENALAKKVRIEKDQDTKSWKSFIPCVSEDPLEEQFQSVYTNDKVREFQVQMRRKWNCQIGTRSESEYEIKEWIYFGEEEERYKKRVSFKVLFNENTNETKCNCQMFEFRGMVCAHQLIVWNDKGIDKVPEKYVFKRWCKNVKRVHTKVRICYDKSSTGIESRRRENMYNAFKYVVESAEECEEKYAKVMLACRKLKHEFHEASGDCINNEADDSPAHDDLCSLEDVLVTSKQSTSILDPEPVRRKGRPPFKRKVGILEKLVKSKRRKLAVGKKTKDTVKKQLLSDEKNTTHHEIVVAADHSVPVVNPCPGLMGSFTSVLNSQIYIPSRLSPPTLMPLPLNCHSSQGWNLTQASVLDEIRLHENLRGSQIGATENQWRSTMFENNNSIQHERER